MDQISYEAPTITELGSIEELTQAGKQSGSLDGSYPVGDPSSNNLFS